MKRLTIIGLGPGSKRYLTSEVESIIKQATCVYIRTEKHPIVDVLREEGVVFKSYDYVYESASDFDTVYRLIAEDIMERLKEEDVIYAVPGNPYVAEKTVGILTEQVEKSKLKICHGTSFLDAIITRLGLDPVQGLRVVDALALDKASHTNRDVLVCIQCYDSVVAGNLKIWLSKLYEDDHPVCIVRGVGIDEIEEVTPMSLYELDRYSNYDHLTSVVVYRQEKTSRATIDDLREIMETLRGENGCPWDREQDHLSLKPYVLEEAYEVAECLERDDIFGLEEELGDLMLQVVFHAQIASENGEFELVDVLQGICDKLIHRHPHVFDDVVVTGAAQVNQNWEAIKQRENSHNTTSDVLKKYSRALPALFRSYKVIAKAAKTGFDWQNVEQTFAKYDEEIVELQEAIKNGQQSEIEDEFGDVLFSLVCVARKLDIDAELALHRAIDKFIKRFSCMEQNVSKASLDMKNMSLKQLIEAWQSAK